jgi:hypothetical protein
LIDTNHKIPQPYRLAYYAGHYSPPSFGQIFINSWQKARQHYKNKKLPIKITKEDISYYCQILFNTGYNPTLVESLLPLLQTDYQQNPTPRKPTDIQSFNFRTKAIDNFYQTNSQQKLLNIFGTEFIKKPRITPKNITDALLAFLLFKDAIQYVKKNKLERTMIVNIIKFKNGTHYFVCLPAINLKPQSDSSESLTQADAPNHFPAPMFLTTG